MPSDVTFPGPAKTFVESNTGFLPWNYLEAAMPQMIGQGTEQARLVLVLPNAEQKAFYAVIDAQTLSEPGETADYIAGLDIPGVDPNDPVSRCFIGPETTQKPLEPGTDDPRSFEIIAEPWEPIKNAAIREVVVVIDAGIAFWNQRFRGQGGSRFLGMRYLDFNLPNAGQSNLLGEREIADHCDLANTEGNAAVVQKLGAAFPNSVFGKASNPDPDAFWHGTAIADLAAGADLGDADDIALFGLELPRAIIADYSGHGLSVWLALILPAAIKMTERFQEKPLTIVMPLGFPGGPQDGSHPAAESINRVMAGAGRENVRLVLPAGNQLQDRCHARLSGGGQPGLVQWDLPPDDYSTNLVEFFGPAAQPVTLTIMGRSQTTATAVTMDQFSYRFAECDGQKIGVLLRGRDAQGWSHTGLALWQTAVTRNSNGTPFGRWTLSSATDMDLWLARDDRDPVADRGRPRRPSWFWDAAYTLRDANGALPQADDPGSAIKRTGTLSALATSTTAEAVQASERLGSGGPQPAGYSSRRDDGQPLPVKALVDDGRPGRGVMAAANGGARRLRVSGTSAAAGLRVRQLVL
jgi:hypothetical protein